MPLSVVDLYRDYLPGTNCRECGYPTCLAFAGMVISSRLSLAACPHIPGDLLEQGAAELEKQWDQGKWVKKDLAAEALVWAKQRASSMALRDLPGRIGGTLEQRDGNPALMLPFFNTALCLTDQGIFLKDGSEPTLWDQVMVYNHLAQGGDAIPTGVMKSFKEFPNTVSKVKSMAGQVEVPIQKRYAGDAGALAEAGLRLGAKDVTADFPSADVALEFHPLPRVPVVLLFWDAEPGEGYEARASLLFDETVTGHLDIESILFLSEKLAGLLT